MPAAGSDCVAHAWERFDAKVADWLLGLRCDEQMPVVAAAALNSGCESPSLSNLAGLRRPDQTAIHALVGDIYRERDMTLPLRSDAISRSARDTLSAMLAGHLPLEQAADRLRRLAERSRDDPMEEDLLEFRELAITLDVAADPECDFEVDIDEWSAQMLSLARGVLRR